MSTFILNYFEKDLKLDVNLRYFSLKRVDNVSKQFVDDSFCVNPLELERIIESFQFWSTPFPHKIAFIESFVQLKGNTFI
ncbi:hypothetical protein A9Q75_11220 [Colwellia psychrerythraea]|uniref:Uncharacterized protein n=1 Tax=Colwellia psychrerythraea TaxID=28229 RepID=A0A1Y5EHF6_COLPS|nr:hypothetical protein A9Q75_11220 [Colwellia psychrerythraea]